MNLFNKQGLLNYFLNLKNPRNFNLNITHTQAGTTTNIPNNKNIQALSPQLTIFLFV